MLATRLGRWAQPVNPPSPGPQWAQRVAHARFLGRTYILRVHNFLEQYEKPHAAREALQVAGGTLGE